MYFNFDIEPVAKGRPKFTRAGFAYTPAKTRQFETAIKEMAIYQMLQHNWQKIEDIPLQVNIDFNLRVPDSYSKKKKQACYNGEIFPAKKPDLDNLIKGVSDALNGVVWGDDSQICILSGIKEYTEGEPFIFVEVNEIKKSEKK